jgi:plastocyanin
MKKLLTVRFIAIVIGIVVIVSAIGVLLVHRARPLAAPAYTASTVANSSAAVPTVHELQNASAANAPRPVASSGTTTTTLPQTVQISITSSGFSPEAVYVKSGATITWTNNDITTHQVDAELNPYASSQPLAGLHSPVLQPGQTYSYTITYAETGSGSVGYYDASAPADKGDIAVANP